MLRKNIITRCLACFLILAPMIIYSANSGVDFRWSGFGSLVLTKGETDQAEYRVESQQFEGIIDDADASIRSRLGIQGDWIFNPNWSITAQVLAKHRGNDAFEPDVEWLFASYKPSSWLDLRAGRMVLPTFLMSDYKPVGYSQLMIEPAISAYHDQNASKFDGAQIITHTAIGSGIFTFKASLGSTKEELFFSRILDVELEDIVGLNVSYSVNDWLFYAGKLNSDLHFTITATIPAPPPFPPGQTITITQPVILDTGFDSFGIQYDDGDWQITAESVDLAAPGSFSAKAIYLTTGKRLGKWTPYLTLSDRKVTSTNSITNTTIGTATKPKSLGVRYDLNNNISLKLQWDEAEPDPQGWIINNPQILTNSKPYNFYGLSLDFIF